MQRSPAKSKGGKDSARPAPEEPPVDVDALLGSIRPRLDASDVSNGSGSAVDASPGRVSELPEEALARSFEVLKRAGPLDPKAPIESHRAVVGPVLVLVKSLFRRALSPAFSSLFEHQATFDRAGLAYADEVYRRIVGMENDLRTRLERIEARQALELETIERRLALLEGGAGTSSAGETGERGLPPRNGDGR